MQLQNLVSIPLQSTAFIDRLRLTLREVDEQIALNPNDLAAHEFRRFLLRAIEDIESKDFSAAA